MHHEDIKAELRKRRSSLSQIARSLDVDPSAVSAVIRRKRSKRIEKAIAKTLGLKARELWPERYGGQI